MISPNEAATLEVVTDETKQLAKIVQDSSLSTETATSLHSSFSGHFNEARQILDESRRIVVTDASQKLQVKLSRDFRLALRKVRIAAEKTKSSLKENSIRYNKAVDGFFNIMVHLTSPEEARLEEQEKFAERQETERKAALRLKRVEQLAPFGVNCDFYNLAEMPDDTFATLLDSNKLAYEQKKETQRRLEQEKIEREAAELKERERVRMENERLKREAAQREEDARLEREKAEQERKAAQAEREKAEADVKKKHEAALAEERRLADEKAKAAKAQADAEAAKAAEAARKERQAIEQKAAKEKQEADARAAAAAEQARKDREAREKAEADLKAAKEAEEKKKRAAEKARKAAARAPDRDKMLAFAKQVRALPLPELSTEEAKTLLSEITSRIEILAKSIERTADTLNADKE